MSDPVARGLYKVSTVSICITSLPCLDNLLAIGMQYKMHDELYVQSRVLLKCSYNYSWMMQPVSSNVLETCFCEVCTLCSMKS